ncbi:sugar phosphate nucleotidyltransferase, partial [Pseudomonas aeruginosa]
ILPADHVIEDQRAFQQALALATNAAEKGEMVLFGIPASRPETGYGYIRASADAQLPEGVSRVQSFVEKPDEARAREFVAAGGYYWNSGMFLFRASRYLEELKKHDADIYDTCLLALERSQHDGDLVNIDAATF